MDAREREIAYHSRGPGRGVGKDEGREGGVSPPFHTGRVDSLIPLDKSDEEER